MTTTRKSLARRRASVGIALLSCLFVAASLLATSGASSAAGIVRVTDFPVPGSDPWGTAFDARGRVWVALPGCDLAPSCPSGTPPGKIALFDPATSSFTTVVSLPAGYGQPVFVAVDHAGHVWFTMPVTNAIGVYKPLTKTVTQFVVPTPSAGPWDLAINSHGKIWFTEHYVNKIASFNPSTLAFSEVATPATNSAPYGITIDAHNNVWFTENTDSVALIGEFTKGTLLEYKIRSTATAGSGLTPHMITVDRSGRIWWSEGWVSAIGELDPSLARPGTTRGVTEYSYDGSCSRCGSHTSGIAAAGNGLIWLDDSLQKTFGSFSPASRSFSFYASPGGHPHDGLEVDPQERIWFDEEFANRLARAASPRADHDHGRLNKSASTSGAAVQLTPAAPALAGSVFYPHPVQSAGLRATFTTSMGSGTGGDGTTGQGPGQVVVLTDRRLTVGAAKVRRAAVPHSTLVQCEVTVNNTGDWTIVNRPTSFVLMDSQGDAFGSSSHGGGLFGPVAAHTSRTGLAEFELPEAAATAAGLRLEYRADGSSEAVILSLVVEMRPG